ncbi:uncharacterized protein LOC142455557 [Tenrec ecaudatus]|uniref:uncharacterized protein LOC142455557 n=1 Tax=Tenrec ecaudatus TaxID=94439 RepID=UPI003F5A3637
MGLFEAHYAKKGGDRAAPDPRRRPPPATRDRGAAAKEAPARAPRGGRNPRAEVSARRGQACPGPSPEAAAGPQDPTPSSGARSALPARPAEPRGGGYDGARTCPAPCGSLGERLDPPGAHVAPPARHVTARPDAAHAGRPRSAAAGSSPGRRPPTCCAARHGRSGSAGAASAPQHGGRGLRRKPGGGEHTVSWMAASGNVSVSNQLEKITRTQCSQRQGRSHRAQAGALEQKGRRRTAPAPLHPHLQEKDGVALGGQTAGRRMATVFLHWDDVEI